MKPEFSRYFLFAYALLGAMHILFHEHETVHHLSKPFLMPLLLLYALSALRKLPGWLVIALLASCLGDSFLMYEARKPVYFVLGLGSFLIAHLAYIILFIKTSEPVSWQLRIKKRGMILGMLLAYTCLTTAADGRLANPCRCLCRGVMRNDNDCFLAHEQRPFGACFVGSSGKCAVCYL